VSMNPEQVKELLKPIDPSRVGKDGKGFSHVEAWDIRRRMNQIFGFGQWSAEVEMMELVAEREVQTRQGKPAWNVVYRARCTVQIGEYGARYTEWAAGDATNPVIGDAHDQAIKTAESQAFKRACVNLGDQFGLSLYKNGSMDASVGDVLNREHSDAESVHTWVAAFEAAQTREELAATAKMIKGADISAADRNTLLAAYTAAEERLSAV